MRRFDKKKHMKKVNILFEERNNMNEFVGLGNDIEFIKNEEEDIDSKIQWFSDEDGDRLTDKNIDS